jgi:hypothetical protein
MTAKSPRTLAAAYPFQRAEREQRHEETGISTAKIWSYITKADNSKTQVRATLSSP